MPEPQQAEGSTAEKPIYEPYPFSVLTEIEPPQLVSSFDEAKKQRKEGGLRTRIPREIIRRIKKVDSDKVFEEVLSIAKSIYDGVPKKTSPTKHTNQFVCT